MDDETGARLERLEMLLGQFSADRVGALERLLDTPGNATDRAVQLRMPGGYGMYSAGNSVYLLANAFWDGTNWNKYDTAQASAAIVIQRAGTLEFRTAAAGSNPFSWATSTFVSGQDSGWIDAGSFGTNWGAYTNWKPRYRKLPSGLVMLDGLLAKSAALATPETMYTLPAGYRPVLPTATTAKIFACASAAGYAQVRVYDDGRVTLESGGSATWTSTAGIVFPAGG